MRIAYSLEYGIDEMEMHEDAVTKGEKRHPGRRSDRDRRHRRRRGQAAAQMGADVVAACFIIDLPDLGGADKLRKLGVPVRTLIAFEGH